MLVALLVIGGAKLLGLAWPWLAVIAAATGVGIAVGIIIAIMHRPSTFDAALWLDRRLGLKERLSNALALTSASPSSASPVNDPEFIDLTVRESEAAAAAVAPRRVVPVKVDWTWPAWPIIGAAALAIGIFAPSMTWTPPLSEEERALIASRSQAAERIAQAAAMVRDVADPVVGDVATDEEIKAIEQLERDLAQGKADPSRATASAAKTLEDVADRLDAQAQESAIAQEELSRAIAEAEETIKDERLAPLAEALKAGDLDLAREAARNLLREVPELSPEARRQLAEDLESLARALDPQGPRDGLPSEATPPAADGESQPSHAQTPPGEEPGETKPPGETPQPREAEQPAEPSDPSSEPTPAQDPAQDPPPSEAPQEEPPRGDGQAPHEPEQSQPREQPDQTRDTRPNPQRDISESMRRLAEEMRRDAQQQPHPGEQPEQRQDTAQQQPSQQPGEQPTQQPRESPSQQPSETPAPQPGQSPSHQPGQERQAQPGETPTQQQPSPHPGEEPSAEPESTPTQVAEPTEDPSSHPGAASEQTVARPTPSSDGEPQEDQPDAGSDGRENLEQVLERLAKEQSRGREARERAEDMRRAARELLESASPQEREAMERWALEKMRERGQPSPLSRESWQPTHDTFDVRPAESPAEADERVIARWFSDEGVDRTGAVTHREAARTIQEAQKGAEQAIERQAVPRRHADLVRRVFQRYSERAGPAAIDAPDANSGRP